jgi:uncharacterized protein (TIGR03437 family)
MRRLLLFTLVVNSAFAQAPAKPVISGVITATAYGGFAAAAPGSFIEIYGTNLGGTSRGWATSDFSGTNAPITLDGVGVTVAGTAAFVSYVSPVQVNVQVPDGIPQGPADVVVTYEGQASDAVKLTINPVQPGLLAPDSFEVNGRQYVAAIHGATGVFVNGGSIPNVPTGPARPGETLILYGTGFGPVQGGADAGKIAPPQATLTGRLAMTIGNANTTIAYAGLAPGLVGLYQLNVVLPANVPGGDQPLQMTLNGVAIALQSLYLTIAGGGVPNAPANVTAVAGDGSASISFASNPNTTYTVTCTGGGATLTASGATSPIVVAGLTNGTTYTCSVTATNGAGTSRPSASVAVTPRGGSSGTSFSLTSSAASDGGTLPGDYTCDGMGSTLQLSWMNPPAGTKEYALLMTTLPGDGTTKWNWVLYNIPATIANLQRDSFLVGNLGLGSDGPGTVYNPPCSQGPGTKTYTYTVYALAQSPVFTTPANQINGQMVTDAIKSITLGTASLNVGVTRAASPTGSSTACEMIRSSTRASKSGLPAVSCDATYAYIGSNGITTQPMMNGITSTNLQVPVLQNFNGANAWKIPLQPTLAAKPTDVTDGPIGVAINGVPIFNPCTQGGCVTGGDTKALGQLDNCNGHAGRADDYHYHAAPVCMMADQPANYWDTHPLGWALDGFAIFGYRDADGTTAARDNVCGGNTKTVPNAPAGYSYHVTDAPPYVASCLAGVPSPDLPNQGAKYHPMRQPPVVPFNNTGMTLSTDPSDGYQVLQFTSARMFTTNETGSDSYVNPPGTYKIRYKQLTGEALAAALAAQRNTAATACWNFQFVDSNGKTTQPTVSYCK